MNQTFDNASIPATIIITGWQKILYTMLVLWLAWVSIVTINQSNRLTAIESNRFTTRDGLNLTKEINEILKNNNPPAWLLKDVEDNKDSIEKLHKQILDSISRLEQKIERDLVNR